MLNNIDFFINDRAHDVSRPVLYLFNEQSNVLQEQRPRQYSPFYLDLSVQSRLAQDAAGALGTFFVGTESAPRAYGVLYAANLPERTFPSNFYLTWFTQRIFGRVTRIYDR
jgi:hypothetical protein